MHFLGLYWGIDYLLFFFHQGWHFMPVRKDNSTRNCCSNTLLVLCVSAAVEKPEDKSEAPGTRPSNKQGPRGGLHLHCGQQPGGNKSNSGARVESFRGAYRHHLQCGASHRSKWTHWKESWETESAWTVIGSCWTLSVLHKEVWPCPLPPRWSQFTFQRYFHDFGGAFSKPKCLQLSPDT